jgi:hypothetical protein
MATNTFISQNTDDVYFNKYLKYKTKYTELQKIYQVGGLPYKGKFIVFYDPIITDKTIIDELKEGESVKMSFLRKELGNPFFLSNNKKKIKHLNYSKFKMFIIDKILKNKSTKAVIVKQIKANTKTDDANIEKKLDSNDFKKDLGKKFAQTIYTLPTNINMDNEESLNILSEKMKTIDILNGLSYLIINKSGLVLKDYKIIKHIKVTNIEQIVIEMSPEDQAGIIKQSGIEEDMKLLEKDNTLNNENDENDDLNTSDEQSGGVHNYGIPSYERPYQGRPSLGSAYTRPYASQNYRQNRRRSNQNSLINYIISLIIRQFKNKSY